MNEFQILSLFATLGVIAAALLLILGKLNQIKHKVVDELEPKLDGTADDERENVPLG